MMRNNQLPLSQKFVGHPDTFAEQAAGILPQIENQALISPISSSAWATSCSVVSLNPVTCM